MKLSTLIILNILRKLDHNMLTYKKKKSRKLLFSNQNLIAQHCFLNLIIYHFFQNIKVMNNLFYAKESSNGYYEPFIYYQNLYSFFSE